VQGTAFLHTMKKISFKISASGIYVERINNSFFLSVFKSQSSNKKHLSEKEQP